MFFWDISLQGFAFVFTQNRLCLVMYNDGMAKMHEYPVSLEWAGGREGAGKVSADRSGVSQPLSVPPEFGGTGGNGTNPEEMLTASIASCYSITFGIIATNRKLPLKNMEVKATGMVEENGPTFTYKSVVISPTIHLDSSATDEQMKMAEDMAHKADSYCIITNAVRDKVEISVNPTITRG